MSISENKVWVLIPAAGIGSRMQSATPKQYLSILGSTILEHTLSCFVNLNDIAGIVVLVGEDDAYWQDIYQHSALLKNSQIPIEYSYGGSDRASTVANGLSFLKNKLGSPSDQWVMVHDAARPCVNEGDLQALLKIRNNTVSDGAILAYPVKDTMKRESVTTDLLIDHTESRDKLWHALTPQLFRLNELFDCLEKAKLASHLVTDEASAMEYCGKRVSLVEGSSDNIKLTSPSDLKLIEFLLKYK